MIGHRWHDTIGRVPHFPFGFGLGYADVTIVGSSVVDSHHVHVDLSNASSRDGAQVVQVYAHLMDRSGLDPDEPEQRLVGFVKVVVPAHKRITVVVEVDCDAYRTWDLAKNQWASWSGEVELRIGTSTRHHACRHVVDMSR